MPLTLIYTNHFINPTHGTFNWVGAPESDVVLLNDFRHKSGSYSKEIMPWNDMLNMLDGSTLHVSTPKTHAPKDALWTRRQPIFATGPDTVKKFHRGVSNVVDEQETSQMDARWQYLYFKHSIKDTDTEILTCGVCFAKLILEE